MILTDICQNFLSLLRYNGKNKMEDKARCCQNCKAPCAGDFKKVVDLQYSGLVIYLHTKKDDQKRSTSKFDNTYILHNTSAKQLKRPEYISELCQFKAKCGQCKTIIQRVRSLLDEIRAIRENEIIGVCEHCKRVSMNKTCKRCDFIVSKFISVHKKRCEEKQERFKAWLCRVKHLLQAILNADSVCQHRVYKDTELERILRELKKPLSMREPDIDFYPNLDPEQLKSFRRLSENKEMLEELLAKMKSEGNKAFSSDDSLYPSPSRDTCICTQLKIGHFDGESLEFDKNKFDKDTELIRTLSNDLSKLLSEDMYKDLIQRLIDLSNDLPGLDLNKDLTEKLLKTINTAIKQGLTTCIIKKLIRELGELSQTLTHDLTLNVNKRVIQGLIRDLNDLLTLGSSKKSQILSKSEITLGSSKKVTKGWLKDLPKGSQKDVMSKDLDKEQKKSSTIRSKGISDTLSKDVDKQLGQKLADLKKSLNKAKGQGSPELLKKVVKESMDKTLGQGLSKDQNKKTVQGLPKGLNKSITEKDTKEVKQSSARSQKRKLKDGKGLSSELSSKALDKGTRKKLSKDLVKQRSKLDDVALKGKKGYKEKKISASEDDSFETGTKSGKSTGKKKSLKGDTLKDKEMKITAKGKENISPGDEKRKGKELKEKKQTSSSLKAQKLRKTSETALLLKMLGSRKSDTNKYKLAKERELARQKEIENRKLKELAMKNAKVVKKKEIKPQLPVVLSESVVECNVEQIRAPKVMVKGNTIARYDPHYKDEEEEPVKPLIFQTLLHLTDGVVAEGVSSIVTKRKSRDFEEICSGGIIRYRLSDREFIDKGWTKLPTKKIMRRMNIYKMEPANPQYNWFELHKEDKELFYDSGDRLADINLDGRGHWYYRNGAVALDYYNAQELNVGQRCVVYSSGTEMENGKIKPRTILALFDALGNGIVYDHYGKVRLKYNQSEGVIVDPKLGPPGRWKWHTLNDPPVLQQVFLNTCLEERDPDIEKIKSEKAQDGQNNEAKAAHPEMLAIELDNFVKEKTNKLLQKFKPFQIRMKSVKINEQFSLKILDQANIYLLFRDGITRLKLNLGMLLISNEIIDTDTSEMTDVATPYDKHLPKSDSVENIQKILKTVRSGKLQSLSEGTTRFSSGF